ncbi:MAG: 50S ribosomal protein L24 [Rectinema sp.]|jgi:large subunit ribosomal protein L24|uniref:Large ribosomal subunit protein uL24 n=1 Tax=uncultured spirochete TaxID=156406 RepID=A0A3P3XND8_9SPIR|nr:50S ribosomal protein L24 [uncultured spirochete]
MANAKYKLRKEDLVQVVAGKDRGKQGKILRIDHEKSRVIVSGINMVKKAMKKKSQTDRGGIVEIEAPVHISNLMIVCKKCNKPVRAGYKIIDGQKKRVCRKCGEVL